MCKMLLKWMVMRCEYRICAEWTMLTICRLCCLHGSKTKLSQLSQLLLSTTFSLCLVSSAHVYIYIVVMIIHELHNFDRLNLIIQSLSIQFRFRFKMWQLVARTQFWFKAQIIWWKCNNRSIETESLPLFHHYSRLCHPYNMHLTKALAPCLMKVFVANESCHFWLVIYRA